MPDSCDRCCANALVRWKRGDTRLYLCQHHSNEHGPELLAQCWVARPMLASLSADPATH